MAQGSSPKRHPEATTHSEHGPQHEQVLGTSARAHSGRHSVERRSPAPHHSSGPHAGLPHAPPHHSPHHHAPPRRDHGERARIPLPPLLAVFLLLLVLPWMLVIPQKLPVIQPVQRLLDKAGVRHSVLSPTQAQLRRGDRDSDGIADGLEDELLRRYSPTALLSPDDASKPSSIGWLRQRAQLTLDGPQLLGTLVPARRFDAATRAGSADPADWVVYGHAYPRAEGGIVLQYWFYFPFNKGPIFLLDHESDWEHVSVELDAQGTPTSFAMARHGNNRPGVRIPWEKVPREGDHPFFLIASGTHAAYLDQDDAPFWETVTDCPRDASGVPQLAACKAIPWRSGGEPGRSSPLVNVGERGAPRLEADADGFFMRYTGLWGEASLFFSGGSAPPGPPFQSGFCALAQPGTCL